MNAALGVELNVMTLYNGRRSVWLALELWRLKLWVSRWDAARMAGWRCPLAPRLMRWRVGCIRKGAIV